MDATKIGGLTPLPDYQQMKAYGQVAPAAVHKGDTKKESDSAIAAASDAKDRVNTTSSVTLRNLDTVKAIESLHTRMNQLIKGVRETNESLDHVAERIDSMKGALSTILKNFPPFPVDSKERQQLLMSVSSLRNEIMKMTFPPPPQPVYEKVKGQWTDLVTPTGQIQSNSLTELHVASSDKEVAAAYTTISGTGSGIAALSSGITQALVQS